ncbi:hypothetical protein ACFXA3_21155 [Streptomyces sp. NPDC059456]|uniref:hypothetical protein n=1 Tax=Streptomyces sp. NPDC059456 TaxID=3346838 RepID=UPI0036BD52E3
MSNMAANGSRSFEDLVHWDGEFSGLIRDARHGEPTSTVTFRIGHAVSAVERVTAGLASPGQLVDDWAQALHFEERVNVEEAHQDLLTQFIVEISTPELFELVTRSVIQRRLRVLQTSMASDTESAGR